MIDLGQWADESFRLPSAPTDIHEEIAIAQASENSSKRLGEYSDDSSDEDLN